MRQHLRHVAVVLGALALAGAGFDTAPATPATAALSAVHLFLTPGYAAPGARVHTIVHLNGLPPGVAVEIQVNPPAPALEVLADLHLHANRAGAVTQAVAFAAPGAGAYTIFVNLGAYADSRSTVPGLSLQAILPVAASWPLLALPCPRDAATALCTLTGYGFGRGETVVITYRVKVAVSRTAYRVTEYRRTAVADAQGTVTRPSLRIRLDPRYAAFQVAVTARGARGDHAQILTASTP